MLKHNERAEVQHESEKHTTVLNVKQFCALMGIKGDGEESSEGGSPVVHSHHHHHHEESKEAGHMSHEEEDECKMPECFAKKYHIKSFGSYKSVQST